MGDDVTEWDNPVHVERKCPLCGATRTRFVDVYSDGDEVVECSFGRQKCNGCGLSCKHWDAIDALTAENAELRKVLGNLTQESECIRDKMRQDRFAGVAFIQGWELRIHEARTALTQRKEGSDACPTVQTEDRRCNICGGLVHYDGTPPVKGCWPAKSRKEPCDAG